MINELVQTLIKWASSHSEILGIILGGSRAKGTATSQSDYDFSISLSVEPSPKFIEMLCKDLALENPLFARQFPQLERHFVLVGKTYRTSLGEVTLGFVNINSFIRAIETETQHTLVLQMFEFIKNGKIIYDKLGTLKLLQERTDISWATRKAITDALTLTQWNFDKYVKSHKKDPTATFLTKSDVIWNMTRVIAGVNNIPLGSKYDYIIFRSMASTKMNFIAPADFFLIIDYLSENNDVEKLQLLVKQVQEIAEFFLR